MRHFTEAYLSRRFLIVMFAMAILLRMALMMLLESWEFRDDWSFGFEMGLIGQWLAEGQGFTLDGESPTAKFPPIYPYVVAGVFSIFGVYSHTSAVVLFLFQSICAAGSAICLVVLGSRLLSPRVGLIAGCIWALYPTSFWYSAIRIWYCELAVLLMLLTIVIAITAKSPPTYLQIAGLGGISGLTILTDSALITYLPILLLWVLLAKRVAWSRSVALVIVWAAAVTVVTSPWMMRNWQVLGSLQLVKSNLGQELFTGNNDFSLGMYAKRKEAFDTLDPQKLAAYRSQSERIYYQYVKNEALKWIWNHPFRFLELTARRVVFFWLGTLSRHWKALSHILYYGPLLALAAFGLWHMRHLWWQLAPIWLLMLIYPLPYYVTHLGRGRFSYPVEPLVVLLAACSLSVWFGWVPYLHLIERFVPKKSQFTPSIQDQL